MAVKISDCRKVAYRFLIGFLAAVVLFTGAFQPRAKAGAVGTIAVVAGVAGALAFSAAWLAYARANGVDLSVYNMLSGQDLVDAITDLVQQYLNDEQDGISANTYFDSIGIPSIVKFAYDTVGSYFTGGVKAIISASGIATVFEPFTQWYLEEKSISTSLDFSSVSIRYGFRPMVTLADDSTRQLSVGAGYAFLPSNNAIDSSNVLLGSSILSWSSDPVAQTVTFKSGLIYRVKDDGSVGYRLHRVYNGVDTVIVNVTSSNYKTFYLGVWEDKIGLFALSGSQSGYYRTLDFLPFEAYYNTASLFAASGMAGLGVMQSADDGTNRYPSTSVSSGKQLEIPVEIPNVSTDYPAASDTEEQRSNDIASAIIAGQIDNDFAVDYTGIEINEEKVITPTVTMPPTLTPTPIEMPPPEEPPETATPTAFPIVTIPPDCPDCPPVGWLTPWPVSPDQFAVVTSDGRTTLVDITDTIKGWTESLTGIYQSYVDLLGSVFGFLPEEIQVLFKWSMAALIFTGIFKRWWWDHH